jgi:hypothetical protein
MIANPKLLEFNCPLCGSNVCLEVHVRRPNGEDYRTSFYRCAGCSVMFLDPERFSLLVRHTFDLGRHWSEERPGREVKLGQGKDAE